MRRAMGAQDQQDCHGGDVDRCRELDIAIGHGIAMADVDSTLLISKVWGWFFGMALASRTVLGMGTPWQKILGCCTVSR